MRDRGYWRCLAALLFLTMSAYIGAALWGPLQLRPAARPAMADSAEGLLLDGLVLRRERPAAPAAAEPRDGARLPAGTALADGSLTDCSVLYYRGTDGWEELRPEELDVPALQALLDAPAPRPSGGGRVVLGFDWVFAALAGPELDLAPGESCRLRFEGREEALRADVLSLGPERDGQRVLLLRLTDGDDYYWHLRRCRAELLRK